jgi:hypothetical protein
LVVNAVFAALTVVSPKPKPFVSNVKIFGALSIVSVANVPPKNSISFTELGSNAMLMVPDGSVSPKI